MKDRDIRGSIRILKGNSEYDNIGRIILELQEVGYILDKISTNGKFSLHDYVFPFEKTYFTFQDFSKCVTNDFMEEKAKNPYIDWSYTSFWLSRPFSVYIGISDNIPAMPFLYKLNWCVTIPNNISVDDEFLQKTRTILQKYEWEPWEEE